MTFFEQMANIGSEVERTINWKNRGNVVFSNRAFGRALELLDLTIASEKKSHRLKELLRLREALVDYFCFDNEYGSSDESWKRYFYSFNFAARSKT